MTALRKELNRIWASSPQAGVVALNDVKYSQGWVAEIPAFQHLNWLHNKMDTNLLALAERGVFEYGSDVTYAKGAIVWREVDGFIYTALVAAPTTAPPSLQWARSCIQLSREDFEQLIAGWTAHIGNKQNPHGTTALQVGAVPSTGGTYTGEVSHTTLTFGSSGKSRLVEDVWGSSWSYDGVHKFNISPTGVPRTYTGTEWREFLYAENYVAARSLYEHQFAVPPADFDLPLTSSLYPAIDNGLAGVVFTRDFTLPYNNKLGQNMVAGVDEPAFGPRGMVLAGRNVTIGHNPLPVNKVFTFSIIVNKNWDDPSQHFTPVIADNQFTLFVSYGQVKLWVVGGDQINATEPTSNTYTITIRGNVGGTVDLFIDGVLSGSTTSELGVLVSLYLGHGADTFYGAEISNFKFWYHPLTNEQIKAV